jgi:perosamine synthetase
VTTRKLAINGGAPVRERLLPYGRQSVDETDIQAVVETLRSDWLTTGPRVREFEEAFSDYVGASHAISVSSGTAGLHSAMFAAGLGPGDEVVVPSITFVASSHCAVFQGAKPVFSDVRCDNLLADPDEIEKRITPRTKAIVAVDYGGHPCDYGRLREICDRHGLILIADSCHALGAAYDGRRVGAIADLTVFSFHPVKHITTGEGGMITTDNRTFAKRLELFRNYGMDNDHRQRGIQRSYYYEIVDLGYNYRLTDLQCALGLRQLQKLPDFLSVRRRIAETYDRQFSEHPFLEPLKVSEDVSHAYHLYVIKLRLDKLSADRKQIFSALRAEGIGVNVHYLPAHLHPYYRSKFMTGAGLCPVAEREYYRLLSLPIFPGMSEADVGDVVDAVNKVLGFYARQ